MKILWLASWYPNRLDKYDGDFVQRHALAASEFADIVVFHLVQAAKNCDVIRIEEEIFRYPNLEEHIVYFPFKKTGFILWDKIYYNFQYYRTYKKVLKKYFKKQGLPSLVHVHVPIKAGRLARWIKAKFKVPYLVHEHWAIYFQSANDNFTKQNKFFRLQAQKAFVNAALVTTESQRMGDILNNLFNIKKIIVLRNVVNTNLFFLKQKQSNIFRFIHVSIMLTYKNVEGIIEALKLLDKECYGWEFVFVGPAKQEWINQTEKTTNKIHWKGQLSYEHVAFEMQQSDMFVLFSNYENQPCVISEAHCCGLPVITTNVGGITEVINENNGILLEAGDTLALFEAMKKSLVKANSFNKENISKEAIEKHSYKKIGKEILQLYNQIIE